MFKNMFNRGSREKRGLRGTLVLAGKIVAGSLRLLRQYPVLAAPLLPVFALVLVISIGLTSIETLAGAGIMMGLIAFTAFSLMLAFGVTSQMIRQIHRGESPSLTQAVASREMLHMLPRILGLSVIWYTLVLLLVLVQMIVSAILDRFSDGLGESVVNAIFGTIADALRMMAFMMVAIMTFEQVGLRAGFRRVREIAEDHAVAALSGLVLTSLVTGVMVLLLIGLSQILESVSAAMATLIFVPSMAVAWILSMFLEQLFVTGLYLYSHEPDSPVVEILLRDVVGRELPEPTVAAPAA
jgi:hypothetical protein